MVNPSDDNGRPGKPVPEKPATPATPSSPKKPKRRSVKGARVARPENRAAARPEASVEPPVPAGRRAAAPETLGSDNVAPKGTEGEPTPAVAEAASFTAGNTGSASATPDAAAPASAGESAPSQDEAKRRPSVAGAKVATAPAPEAAREPSPGKQVAMPARKQRHPIRAVVVTLVALVAILSLAAAWQYWWRYDDTADIKGEWKVASAEETVVIDGQDIHLVRDVDYAYALDTQEKTIRFGFSTLSGGGTYRFSPDRQTLIIDESGTDPGWMVRLGLQEDPVLSSPDTIDDAVTILMKVSDDTSRKPTGLSNNSTPDADNLGAAIVSGEAVPDEDLEGYYYYDDGSASDEEQLSAQDATAEEDAAADEDASYEAASEDAFAAEPTDGE